MTLGANDTEIIVILMIQNQQRSSHETALKILKYVKIIIRFRELRHWLYYRKENVKRKFFLLNKEKECYLLTKIDN